MIKKRNYCNCSICWFTFDYCMDKHDLLWWLQGEWRK